jgi:hypothetical protein
VNLQESIRKDLEALDAPIVTEEQSNIYNVKVTSSHTGYVEITAESEDEAIDEALQYAYKYSVDYDPEEDITAEIVNDDSINEAGEESDSFTYNRDGVPTEHEITEQDKYVMNVLEKLRGLYADLKANGIELPSHGSDGNAMDVLYDDLTGQISRYTRYYLKVPALDGGDAEHSHPYLG